MRILVLGNGAREHALVWKLAQSEARHQLFVSPGNSGMESLATILRFDGAHSIQKCADLAEEYEIDLTIVGPESLLVEGVVDHFHSRGLRIFGPTEKAARLEGSKVWAKEVMQSVGIPTANWRVFEDYLQARSRAEELDWQCVIKADGLAAGKGSFVCESEVAVDEALLLLERTRATSSKLILVEELLVGQEVSVFALSDGRTVVPFGAAQDHKRLRDHDEGPNTGGMGAYSPVNHMLVAQGFADSFFQPLIRRLRAIGTPYVGVLYAGAIVTNEGPKILEFNCRFGDPEAEVLLRRLDSDLAELLDAATQERLHLLTEPSWNSCEALGVVAAALEYPEHGTFPVPIYGIEDAERVDNVVVFHAGTETDPISGQLLAHGGRVLCVTAVGDNLHVARERAYQALERIKFEGMQFRGDIGNNALPGPWETQWRKSPRWAMQMRAVTNGLDSVASAMRRLQISAGPTIEVSDELDSIRQRIYALKLQTLSPEAELAEPRLTWDAFVAQAGLDNTSLSMADEVKRSPFDVSWIALPSSVMRLERHKTYDMLVWTSSLTARTALDWLERQRDAAGAFYVDTSDYSYSFEPADVELTQLLTEPTSDIVSIRLETPSYTCLWSAPNPVAAEQGPSFAILGQALLLDDVWWFFKGSCIEEDGAEFVRVLEGISSESMVK